MRVTFIRKTARSGDTNCPALYATDRGTYLVQGWPVPGPGPEGVRDLGTGEVLVEVPADVLDGHRDSVWAGLPADEAAVWPGDSSGAGSGGRGVVNRGVW
jgi:hypothetical protein